LQAGRKKPFRYTKKQSDSTPRSILFIPQLWFDPPVYEEVEEAVSAIKKAIQISPDSIISHTGLAATYSMMGREKEARAEAAEFSG